MARFIILLLLYPVICTAQSAEDKAVSVAVENLRKALVDPERRVLEALTSEKLSYGHSSGKIEDQASFIDALVSGKSDFRSVAFADQQITVSGDVAVVRHRLTGETQDGEKVAPVNIGVLLIWQKQRGQWKLIARQAFKL